MRSAILTLIGIGFLLGCTTSEPRVSMMERFYGPPPDRSAPSFGYPSTNAPARVLVMGQVRNPGRYAWTNGMTVADVLVAVGGLTDYSARTLYLQHWDCSVERLRLTKSQTPTSNPVLKPGDSVISPLKGYDYGDDDYRPARSFLPNKTLPRTGAPHFGSVDSGL